MIDAWAREVLRQQAVGAWERAKVLYETSNQLVSESREAVRASQGSRASRTARSGHLDELHPSWQRRHPAVRQWIAERQLEYLADRAIRRFNPAKEDRQAADGGAALVASVNMPTLVRLEELLGSRVGFVAGAPDAGTALGLAISTQPDIAIIDSRLDLANGADLVLTLPTYAPKTRSLLLTDDETTAARVGVVGVDVLARTFSEPALLAWIGTAMQ